MNTLTTPEVCHLTKPPLPVTHIFYTVAVQALGSVSIDGVAVCFTLAAQSWVGIIPGVLIILENIEAGWLRGDRWKEMGKRRNESRHITI